MKTFVRTIELRLQIKPDRARDPYLALHSDADPAQTNILFRILNTDKILYSYHTSEPSQS